MQKINKNSALKEVEEFQNLIQKQNEKYLQNMNFINQNLYQNHNNNKMSNSYKDILYTEHSNEKALEKFNYSAIFDPEIMKILNPNTSDKISKKNNDILPKKNEKINNNMNSSLYSFVDNLSHPPSREFRCSRHFLEFEGRTDYNKKNPRNKGKSIRNRMFSYNGFDRQKKKLDQVIRRLSFREINFLTPIIIDSKEVKEKLINDNKEINKKMMGKKKFNIRNKFRNFDNMLKEIKGDDIVKIIYSIEGIIQTETKKTVSNPKQPWRIPLKL